MKTSRTDPIRVDYLSPAHAPLPGRIGLTIAPGKKDPTRSWDRDLTTDLERLKTHYKTDLLVSLMEDREYDLLKIPHLHTRAAELGLTTVSFPIPDVDAPPPSAMPAFAALVRRIVDTARAGSNVVIHCRGGLGRSGLVAASCLVALGHEPDPAIHAVRAARAGAVEVASQEHWVHAFAKHPHRNPVT